MSAKRICLVHFGFENQDLSTLSCTDKSHTHISNSELREYRDLNIVETDLTGNLSWLRQPSAKAKGVIRMVRQIGIRGLSCKIGDELACAVQDKEPWAVVMYANQRMQREHASNCEETGASEIYDVWQRRSGEREEAVA